MKKRITSEQLNDLTDKGREKLRERWVIKHGDWYHPYKTGGVYEVMVDSYGRPDGDKTWSKGNCAHYPCYPLLTIGDMIEFLDEEGEINEIWYRRTNPYWHIELTNRSLNKGADGHIDIDGELCDTLWAACVEVLNK